MKSKLIYLFLSSLLAACSLFGQKVINNQLNPIKKTLEPFLLSDVKLLPGSLFYKAMETSQKYLLSLDIDRLLVGPRKQNGITTNATSYGGWETGGGIVYGHYLSGCALMYASTGDKRFIERVNGIIAGLKEVQANTSDGWFLGGKEGLMLLRRDTLTLVKPDEAGQPWNFNNNGNFWYSAHKILTGLRDAYLYTGNKDAKEILLKLGSWLVNWSDKVNKDLLQAVLSVEQGGMNEVIADIYSITGDEKYLELAKRFTHINVVYPVAVGEDVLCTRHANDQIPKFVGAARIYELSGNNTMKQAAFNFWDMVLTDHTSIIGGNGLYERFGKPGELSKRLGYSSSETCNTYNMLKLTKQLYSFTGNSKYMDYYERALYNHILSSQEPETGNVCYFTSTLPGLFKYYSTHDSSFWCCVATGMENHAKYNEDIYFYSNENLYVNLFIPSELNWTEKGLKLKLKTSFPESDTVKIEIVDNKSYSADIYLRDPSWLSAKPTIIYNKMKIKITKEKGYFRVNGNFKKGDQITVVLPQSLHIETIKDDKYLSSILYGPIVLAGELGTENLPSSLNIQSPHGGIEFPRTIKNVPYFVASKTSLESWVKKDNSGPLQFHAAGAGTFKEVSLIPFYKLHHQRYSLYWKLYSTEEFKNLPVEFPDEVIIGDSVSEKEHNFKGVKTETENFKSAFRSCETYRFAKDSGWFSYELKINPLNTKHFLMCTFSGDEPANTQLDIIVDGTKIVSLDNYKRSPFTTLDDVFELPGSIWKGKAKVTVLFRPKKGNSTGGLYGIRIQNEMLNLH